MKWYVDDHSARAAAIAHGPIPACVPLAYVARKSRRRLLGRRLSRQVVFFSMIVGIVSGSVIGGLLFMH